METPGASATRPGKQNMKNMYAIKSQVVDDGQIDTVVGHYSEMPSAWLQAIIDKLVHERQGKCKSAAYSAAYKTIRAELQARDPRMQLDMKHPNIYDSTSEHDRAIPVNRRGHGAIVSLTLLGA